MKTSRQEILDYVLKTLEDLAQDWDQTDAVTEKTLLFSELGFESLDAVVLGTNIQDHFDTQMPFSELLVEIGEQQRDLSVGELVDFIDTHVSRKAAAETA